MLSFCYEQDKGLAVKTLAHMLRHKRFLELLAILPPSGTNIKFAPPTVESINTSPTKRQKKIRNVPSNFNLINKEINNESMLPLDCLLYIFNFLRPCDLLCVSRVCLSWYSLVANNNSLWKHTIRLYFNDVNDVLIQKNEDARKWYLKWRRNTLTYRC